LRNLLLLLLAIVIIWRLVHGFRRRRAARKAPGAVTGQMVSCGHCGLYLPQSEAVSAGDRFYCCDEHRRLAD
jgi:uncharacterized protein